MAEKRQTKITDHTYSVGYGRPPKQGQFQKGVSGNPGGRPPGTRGLVTELREILQETTVVTEKRKPRKVSKAQAMLISLVNRAISGDTNAFKTIAGLVPDRDFEQATEPLAPIETDKGLLIPNAILYRQALRRLEHLFKLKITGGDVSYIVMTKEESIELCKELSEIYGCQLGSKQAVKIANTSLLVKEADEEAQANSKNNLNTAGGASVRA